MRGIGGSTLRGGQTVFHGIRMWGQLFQAAMLFAAFMTVAVPAWNLWRSTTGAEWYAASMVSEGFSYGANTIRDGVSLTPRRELRALALPSEIMRLANLEGYLKFPGPFPVASIRLKYVARPAAAERFVPREDDGAEAKAPPADATAHGGAAGVAFPDGEDIGIPEPAGPAEAGPGDAPGPPDMPAEPASWQGELDLLPLPGEAGDPNSDGAVGETADANAPESEVKAPDADAAAPAAAPQDGPPEAGSAPAGPPDSDAGGGRGSDWG